MSQSMLIFWRHTWLISRVELVRLFASPRGWFALGAFAVIWFFLLRYPIYHAAAKLQQTDIQAILSQMVGMVGMHKILAWPLPELIVYWLICLVLLPFVVLITSADQTSSDCTRGTLRFLTLRTSRDSIFLGRFLGQMMVQALLILLSLLATLGMGWFRQQHLSLPQLEAALIMALNLLIVLAPFTALMALCSALMRSARMAICLAIVAAGIISGALGWIGHSVPAVKVAFEYLPGAQIIDLLSSQGWQTLQYAPLPIAQTLILLGLGRTVMQGKSI